MSTHMGSTSKAASARDTTRIQLPYVAVAFKSTADKGLIIAMPCQDATVRISRCVRYRPSPVRPAAWKNSREAHGLGGITCVTSDW